MKMIRFLVPSLETVPLKKLIGKRLFSTVLATLALSAATLNTARHLPSPSAGETEGRAANSMPLGLSRKRPDFNKAIEILADAAAANQHLADYYESVTKRVKGDGTNGEDSSGIDVIKPVRRANRAVVDATTVQLAATSDAESELAAASLSPPRETAITPESIAEPIYSTENEVSQSSTDGAAGMPPPFTVGDMAFDTNPAIEHWINYYGATPVGRRTMTIGIVRSNAYLEMARTEFRSAGVPEDLVWLALVESVWNPRAVSPAAAGGIWQFIPATATDYGLRVQSGDDERANPLKQTRVAAAYLHDLYTIFGDWALAMAAYNSGEPRVMGAIVKNGRANFWDLYEKQLLPKETRNYVPKILAAIKIASQAEHYGFAPQPETEASAGS